MSTATFIGFHLLGWKGALAATVGVFLPSFVYAGLMHPLLNAMVGPTRWKASSGCRSIGALAIMAAVVVRMGIYFLEDPGYVLIAILAVLGLAFPT
ncbi:MAG: chromate transporter [Haliscomenobacter sp.]|nr:chromate transporter [Haliscomenobacter sp.]